MPARKIAASETLRTACSTGATRTGVEFEGFEEPNDVLVRNRHRAIVTDRRGTVLVLAPSDLDSKCRGRM
jgi:hypothetical protein